MSDVPESFNWVKHCGECTAPKVFEKLLRVVKSDVAAAEGRARHAVEFEEIDKVDDRFAVRRRTSPIDVELACERVLFIRIRLAGDSSTNAGINSRNGLGTLEVPNGNGAVSCIGSIGASPLRVTIPAWVGRS